jgi:hypothetical protein
MQQLKLKKTELPPIENTESIYSLRSVIYGRNCYTALSTPLTIAELWRALDHPKMKDHAFKPQGRYRGDMSAWFRHSMPYYFMPILHEDTTLHLPLNRFYKPLGFDNEKWVDYNVYTDFALQFKCNSAYIKHVWTYGCWKRNNPLFLYNDDPDTRRGYVARLRKVLKHTVGRLALVKETAPLS